MKTNHQTPARLTRIRRHAICFAVIAVLSSGISHNVIAQTSDGALVADFGLFAPPASDTTEPRFPGFIPAEETRRFLDEHLKSNHGKSQLQAIQDIYKISEREARKKLEEMVKYYSSTEFQSSVHRADKLWKAAETTAEYTVIATDVAQKLLGPVAAAPKGIAMVTVALADIAAESYKMRGKMLQSQGKAEGDQRMIDMGKAMEDAGGSLGLALKFAKWGDTLKLSALAKLFGKDGLSEAGKLGLKISKEKPVRNALGEIVVKWLFDENGNKMTPPPGWGEDVLRDGVFVHSVDLVGKARVPLGPDAPLRDDFPQGIGSMPASRVTPR